MVGAAVMFVVLLWKWGSWLCRLPRADKKRILFGLPTRRTLAAVWEVISESLLHQPNLKCIRIERRTFGDPLLQES